MALLPKPLTVWVTGTDHHRYGFDRWRNNLTPNNRLILKRIRDNEHDKNAVAVMYAGHQLGWVAKADARWVGPALDEGCRFEIKVVESRPDHCDQNRRLQVSLEKMPWTPAFEPPSVPKAPIYQFNGEIGESGSHRAVPRQNGKAYRLRTTTVRSTIDLVDEGGGQAGWIRKADIPYWNAIADRLDRFYAVTEGSALYLSEDYEQVKRYVRPAEGLVIGRRGHYGAVLTEINGKPVEPLKLKSGDKLFFDPATQSIEIKKETTMNLNAKNIIARLIDTNKRVAADAGYLEAGRIANNAIGNFLVGRLSWLERFFNRKHLQSPAGKLVIANGALLLAAQLRPDDARVKKLTEAMATQAYQELYQQVDIEGLIENLMATPDIQRALRKIEEPKAAAE